MAASECCMGGGEGGFHGEKAGLPAPISTSVSCLLTHINKGHSTALTRWAEKQNPQLLGGLADSRSVLVKKKGKVEDLGDSLKF